eukprot:scaffold301_cov243-Pinguiococcus_pyrenoidosus.AAC.78
MEQELPSCSTIRPQWEVGFAVLHVPSVPAQRSRWGTCTRRDPRTPSTATAAPRACSSAPGTEHRRVKR